MKKILTFGVFDYFHYGHLILLEKARSFGDFLIVAIQEDDSILKYKPNAQLFYSTKQRVHMIQSLNVVDEVVLYKDVDIDIKNIDFDVLVVGADQKHQGFKNAILWCNENGKEVIFVERTLRNIFNRN